MSETKQPEYRWNVDDFAKGYDAAAEHIHPYYTEIQATLLDLMPFADDADALVIDAGGGSGRFIERFLQRFEYARAIVIDQSEPFLALAERRLHQFGDRAHCRQCRLQDDWSAIVTEPEAAIVSMSAVHHLDADEKKGFYQRCYDVLRPDGVLMNGDEVRAADDGQYLAECKKWVARMHRVMDAGLVTGRMCESLRQWEIRNVGNFGQPRASGDDCHQTVDDQLGYFKAAGFETADTPWQKEMWAIMRAKKGKFSFNRTPQSRAFRCSCTRMNGGE